MKIPDKCYTKLWKSFQRNRGSAAHWSTHVKIIQDDHKSTFYIPFPDIKLLFFSLSQAHFSNTGYFFRVCHFSLFVFCRDSQVGTRFFFCFFFLLAVFFEFTQSYQAERKVEQRVEQTRFRDKQNLPPTAGDGNYSGSGNHAASLWLCKVHSKSQSLSSLYFLCVCQAVCLPVSSSQPHLFFHLLFPIPLLFDPLFKWLNSPNICHHPTCGAATSECNYQPISWIKQIKVMLLMVNIKKKLSDLRVSNLKLEPHYSTLRVGEALEPLTLQDSIAA